MRNKFLINELTIPGEKLFLNGENNIIIKEIGIAAIRGGCQAKIMITFKEIAPTTSKYVPLTCGYCGKDLLVSLFKKEYPALIAFVSHWDTGKNTEYIEDIYCACKGDCDRTLQAQVRAQGYYTTWRDISDLGIPIELLRTLLAIMNDIRAGNDIYKDAAYKKMKKIFTALAQKVLRFTPGEERRRILELLQIPL